MDNRILAGGASRRSFLSGALAGAAAFTSAALIPGLAAAESDNIRSLSFRSLHTGEEVTATYLRNGVVEADGLAQLNHVLRDWRSGEVWEMDRGLLDLLYALRRKMDSDAPFELISGYRSPKTNAGLAAKSKGVAKRSLHMRGMAVDVRLPERDLKALHQAALDLKGGGVGLYTKSGFIHLDTGRVRRWGA